MSLLYWMALGLTAQKVGRELDAFQPKSLRRDLIVVALLIELAILLALLLPESPERPLNACLRFVCSQPWG